MDNKDYESVFITIKLSSQTNKLLSEAAQRSHRRKLAEARLRIEDHLRRFRHISELNQTIPHQPEALEANHDCTSNS